MQVVHVLVELLPFMQKFVGVQVLGESLVVRYIELWQVVQIPSALLAVAHKFVEEQTFGLPFVK